MTHFLAAQRVHIIK